MAIAVTGKLQSFSGTTFGTGAYTTGAFTPANNSLLLIYVASLANTSSNIGSATITDNLGAHLTYTTGPVSHYDIAFSHNVTAFTAPVGTGASMTLTVDHGAQNIYQYVVTVIEITGYDTGTPTGGSAVSTADIGDGGETQTLSAAPGTNDVTFVYLGIDDSGSAATPTMGAGSWTSVYDGVSNLAAAVQYRTASTSTSVPVTDVYTGAGAYDKGLMSSFVIKAAAGGTDATATPSTVDAVASVDTPTLSTGETITATTVDTVASVAAPTVGTGSSVTASTVDTIASVDTPTIATGSTVSATTVEATASIDAPAISTGSTVTASVIDALVSVDTPTVSTGADATVTPSTVDAVSSVDAPVVATGDTVTASTVDLTSEIGTPTITTGASISPSTVDAVASIATPTVAVGSVVTATVVDALISVDAPSVSAGGSATATPTVIDALASIDTPTVGAGSGVTAATVETAVSITAPTIGTGSTVTASTVEILVVIGAPTVTGSTILDTNPIHVTYREPSGGLTHTEPGHLRGRDAWTRTFKEQP